MKKILIIGQLCQDIIMHNPQSVSVMGQNVWAEDIIVTFGGSAAYVSTALEHLGMEVDLWSTVGDDDTGLHITANIEKLGVDLSHVKVLKGMKTTRSMIVSKYSKKEFIGCSPMLPMVLPSCSVLENTCLIYIAGYMLYPELWSKDIFDFLEKANKIKIPILLDCQLNPTLNDSFKLSKISELLRLTHTFFMAEKEAAHIFGSIDRDMILKKILPLGVQNIILKHGDKGSELLGKNKGFFVKGYKVNAFDNVGAGDIYGAGYAYGVMKNWDILECIKFSTVFSALSLTKYEHYKEYPSLNDVKTIINEMEW